MSTTVRSPADHHRAVASDSIGGGFETDPFLVASDSIGGGFETDPFLLCVEEDDQNVCGIRRSNNPGSNNYAPQECLSHSRAHYLKVFQSGRVYHRRNMSDVPMSDISGSMITTHSDLGNMLLLNTNNSRPINIEILASSLTNATPEQKWWILGQNLYPLVDHLAHNHAEKIIGMILEMDQKDILHLLVSPDTLKAKVSEAMKVFRCAIISALVDASPEQ